VARLYRVYSTPVGPAVILQRGCFMEKFKTSEHLPFHRRYDKPFANCPGVDAERNSDRVRRENPSTSRIGLVSLSLHRIALDQRRLCFQSYRM